MWLNYFRQLYSLDTLDTRFVVPATVPPKEALEAARFDSAETSTAQNGRSKGRKPLEGAQPARWRTLEFYFYFVSVGYSIWFMVTSVYGVSKG